jgi:hypothetical protein
MTTYTLIFWTVTTVNSWGFSAEVLQHRTVEYRSYHECLATVEAVKPKAWRCVRKEFI